MSVVSGILVFVCVWWLVLLPTITYGQSAVASPERGHDRGAPANPRLRRRVLMATAITFSIYIPLMAVLLHYGVADL